MSDFNTQVIEEFRSAGGEVGGRYEGSPVVLVHHHGRRSGRDYVSPMMYLPDADDPATVYVFASAGGAEAHPGWYHNLRAAGRTSIEIGADTVEVEVRELDGEERARIYAEQAARYPRFGGYETATAGIRVIPVLALRRTAPLDADPPTGTP